MQGDSSIMYPRDTVTVKMVGEPSLEWLKPVIYDTYVSYVILFLTNLYQT